ncbi:unnamed protein product [Chrysoparadoxa australica]
MAGSAEPGANGLLMLSYCGLFGLWAASNFVLIPVTFNLIASSTLIIYIGSHRSLRLRDKSHPNNTESETISSEDAYKFPIMGSAVLFGLYVLIKFIKKELLNMLLSAYFSALGAITLASTVDPMVHMLITSERKFGKKFNLKVMGEVDLTFTPSQAVSFLLGSVFSAIYFKTKHWAMNNVFGISFCVQAMERISLGNYKVGAILLCGLFLYDIFWVFATPVMVAVAKGIDAPIKLLFPRVFADLLADPPIKAEYSMLGLGDIVIPGIFIALLLRYDAERAGAEPKHAEQAVFSKPFFLTTCVSYVLGLGATVGVMYYFNAAQPALLYLVPACLLSSLLLALCRKEFKALIAYTEEEEEEEEPAKAKSS